MELRESQVTAQGAGFAQANNASAVQEYAAETAEAIENLANAAVQNQTIVHSLTTANATLSTHLAQANEQLAAALATITTLQGIIGNATQGARGGGRFGGAGRGGGGGRNQINGRGGGRGQNAGRGRTVRIYNNTNYCHTHGYDIHGDHTSESCNTPAVGHRHDATLNDNKGGSQKFKDLVT